MDTCRSARDPHGRFKVSISANVDTSGKLVSFDIKITTMQKLITILLIVILVTGCVSKREAINTANQVAHYQVKEKTKARATGTRLWILFIPIGIGANKYDTRKEKVIHRFMKHTRADAIQAGEIVDRKFVIPLIVVNFSFRICTITGKPCYLQTDSLNK